MSAELEARLRALEDRAAIQDLIAGYGPAVDSADEHAVSAMWADGGTYQIDDDVLRMPGVGALVRSAPHRGYLARGCAHFLSSPRIDLDGDTAVALNHSCLLAGSAETGEWVAARVSANRWDLVRTPEGWRVLSRVARLLDGDEAARAVFR